MSSADEQASVESTEVFAHAYISLETFLAEYTSTEDGYKNSLRFRYIPQFVVILLKL
ncbi:MAG: hypothetical protein AAF849_02715 [Bacteroidota bacterium]